jgi:hypothetical protein
VSGSYTGNATDNRSLTGVGFQPDVVLIKSASTGIAVLRTSSMSGDNTKPMTGTTALTANQIQALGTDGFTIGTDAAVNANGTTYYWIAFKAVSGKLTVGSYTGDGQSSHAITGVGFSPALVFVMGTTANNSVLRSTGGTMTYPFDGDGNSGVINSLDASGFTVGSDARVNASSTTYYYAAWATVSGQFKVGSYTGNGTDNTSLTGVGFLPEFVIVKAGGPYAGAQHSHALGDSTDSSQYFTATANAANEIQSLTSSGFTIGTAQAVNQAGVTYAYFAWKQVLAGPTKLAITSVNGGSNPTAGTGFSVVVQAQDAGGTARNVVSSTAVTLSLNTGGGTLDGTLTGTISAGSSSVTISGVTYTKAESGVMLTATGTSGDSLTAGNSASFSVNTGAFAKLQLLMPGETAAPGTTTGKTGTPTAQALGTAFSVTVNAVDANWNLISTNDTVAITSGDAMAVLPANASLVNGSKSLSVALNTIGSQTITASDITHSGITANTVTVVIAPTLTWSTFLGAAGSDYAQAVAVDSSGNVYLAGYSSATWGSPVRTFGTGTDAFVAKLDSSGTLLWNTFLGGTGTSDQANGITVDSSGNVYVVGNANATWGSPVRAKSTGVDAFVAKLDSSGALTWNTFLGGGGSDYGYGISVDGSGNVYVAGNSSASWTSPASPVRAYTSSADAFAVKLSSSGAVTWHTFLGGSGSDGGRGIAVDASGNVYVGGYSSATWQGSSSPVRAYSSSFDLMAAKLSSAGALTWNTFLDATWGSPVQAFSGGVAYDAIAVKLNNSGALTWNTFMGASGVNDSGYEIAMDGSGNIYVGGSSDATWGSPWRAYASGTDAFAANLDSSGNATWNTFLGGSGTDQGNAIAADGGGNVYVAGYSSANWGSPVRSYSGGNDAFVVKIAAKSDQTITFPSPGNQTYGAAPITLTATASSGLAVTYSVTSGPATVNGNTLTITGAGSVVIQASQAGNSSWNAATPASQTISVGQKAVTISSGLTANNKVYTGDTTATISSNNVSLSGVVAGDASNVSLSTNGYSASFASAAVGTSKTVTVSGLTLTGSAAGNYSLTQPTLSANITAAAVTVASGLTANNKVYDGTATATISSNSVSLSGVVAGDTSNLSLSTNSYAASFFSAAVGAGTTVTVSGLTLTGSAAGNYSLTQPTLSANITPGTAAKLAFTTQPGAASPGTPFGQQPVVQTQDQYGNASTVGLAAHLTVTVTLASGTGPLRGTTELDIGTSAGNGHVSFSSLRIDPAGNKQLTASASGLTGALSATFNVPDAAPVANTADFTRPRNVPLKLLISNLLTNTSDPNGDTLTLVSVSAASTNGAALYTNCAFVLYDLPPSGNATDSFTYTVSDGTATTSGTVLMSLRSAPTGTNDNQVACAVVNGKPTMTFAAVPGHSYTVQRTLDLSGTPVWTDLVTTNAPAGGLFQFVDLNPPGGTPIYRAINP